MNKLCRMTKENLNTKKSLQFNDVKYIVIDSAGIETYEQYFDKLWEAFDFREIQRGRNRIIIKPRARLLALIIYINITITL